MEDQVKKPSAQSFDKQLTEKQGMTNILTF